MVVVSRILVCPKQDSCVSSFSLPDGLLISREFLLLGVCFLSKGEGFAVLALWGQLFGHKIRRSVRAMIITPLPWNYLYLKPSVLAFPFFCHLAPIFSSLSTYIYMPFNKKRPSETLRRGIQKVTGEKKKRPASSYYQRGTLTSNWQESWHSFLRVVISVTLPPLISF